MRRCAFLFLLAAGCGDGPAPRPSDAAVARQALSRALDAWKAGATPESLATGESPVVVSDNQWKRGAKLTDYSLAEKSDENGFDLRFTAKLTVADAPGKAKPVNALYDVSTHPRLVVVRAEAP